MMTCATAVLRNVTRPLDSNVHVAVPSFAPSPAAST